MPQTTQNVIGTALTVLNELKAGLTEKCYEEVLLLELQSRGHETEQEIHSIYSRRNLVGKFAPGILVDSKVAVDAKGWAVRLQKRIRA